jgi:SNF2 family DNA or RNA helicase
MYDLWWNPALENQAIARAHRFGKKVPLTVVRFFCRNTIEEKIKTILDKKEVLFDEVVNQTKSAKTKQFTKQELFEMLEN